MSDAFSLDRCRRFIIEPTPIVYTDGVCVAFVPSPVITGTHNETERTMNPKKKTPAIKPACPVGYETLSSLLQDRAAIEDDILQAQRQIDALQQTINGKEAAHATAISKIVLFMRERDIRAARCSGLLIVDHGDRLDIKPDHYTHLSA